MAITKIRGAQIADDTVEGTNLSDSVAGNGLQKDGSENLEIGSGTGITVNANSIEVDTSVIATKTYVDNAITGLDLKDSVRVGTTQNLALESSIAAGPTYSNTGGASGRGQITAALAVPGTFTVDGVSLVDGDRILVKDENGGLGQSANGIYIVSIAGAGLQLDRATDFDEDDEVTSHAFMFIEEGSTQGDTGWVLNKDNPVVVGGASGGDLIFVQFSGSGSVIGGNGIDVSGTTVSVDLAASSALSNTAGGGDQLAVVTDGYLSVNGSNQLQIDATSAGAGLTGGAGSPLAVGAGNGITVNADDIEVKLNSNGGLVSNLGAGIDELSLNLATNAGLALTANELAVNVQASGGLDLVGNELSVDINDIIDTSAGLENSGGDIGIKIDDTGVTHFEFNTTNGIRLADTAAGNGLTGGGAAALSVEANLTVAANIANVIDVGVNGVAVKIDDTMFDQDGSNQLIIANGGVDTAQLAADSVNDTIIDLGTGANQVNASTFGFSSSSTYLGSATNIEDALEELEAAGFTNSDYQRDVLDVVDGLSVPPTAVIGDRYILGTNANFAYSHAWHGLDNTVSDGDIVQCVDGINWFVAYDVSANGAGAMAWNTAAGAFYQFDGTTWEVFEAVVTASAAGDGLDFAAGVLSVKAGDGLEIISDNVRIAASAAGDGLKGGGGSALAVEPADFAGTGLEDDGSDNLRIAASAAGDGLKGGGGSALAVEPADFAGTGLEDDGSDNLRIAASAAGTGLTGGGGSPLAIDVAGTVAFTTGASYTFGTGTTLQTSVAPTSGNDVANKDYVDTVAQGLDVKESVRLATVDSDLVNQAVYNTTYNSGQLVGAPLTIDGVAIAEGDRILVKTRTDAQQNGIYVVTATTHTWNRAADHDGTPSSEVSAGNFTFVEQGTQAGTGWVVQGNGEIALNVQDIVWTQFNGAAHIIAGAGLSKTGNELSVDLGSNSGLSLAGDTLQISPDSTTGATVAPLSLNVNGAGVTVDNDTIVHATGTISVGSGSIGTNELEDAGVTEAKLSSSVAGAGLSGGAGTSLSVNAGDSGAANLANVISVESAGISVKIDDITIGENAFNQLEVKASSIGTNELEDAGVTEAKLSSSVAGAGLSGGAGTSLSVNAGDSGAANLANVISVESAGISVKIDDTTIGENGFNQLEVKDSSIGLSKLTGLGLGQIYVGSGSAVVAGSYIIRENLSATVDGVVTAFTLASTPFTGTEQVFLNGILQNSTGSADYSISGATITFTDAPVLGDVILVNYIA